MAQPVVVALVCSTLVFIHFVLLYLLSNSTPIPPLLFLLSSSSPIPPRLFLLSSSFPIPLLLFLLSSVLLPFLCYTFFYPVIFLFLCYSSFYPVLLLFLSCTLPSDPSSILSGGYPLFSNWCYTTTYISLIPNLTP